MNPKILTMLSKLLIGLKFYQRAAQKMQNIDLMTIEMKHAK